MGRFFVLLLLTIIPSLSTILFDDYKIFFKLIEFVGKIKINVLGILLKPYINF